MRSRKLSIFWNVLSVILAAVVALAARPATAQQEKVLHSFNSNGTDGVGPVSGLILDKAGNLYGTTQYGGAGTCNSGGFTGCGTVFELSPKPGGGWVEKILHNFVNDKVDGSSPRGMLIFDAVGNLYGTTYYGGSGSSVNCMNDGGCGTVFELSRVKGVWTEKVLHSFTQDGTDGIFPTSNLVFDGTGNLFGTTDDGGGASYYSSGTVFELTPIAGGSWTETILHSFPYSNGTDGYYPAGLLMDAAGNFYGATFGGGA